MKQNLLALCLCAALLVGAAPAQAAPAPTDNVDRLTWQQASAYYSLLQNESNSPYPYTYVQFYDFDGNGVQELFLIHTGSYEVYGLENGASKRLTSTNHLTGTLVSGYLLDALCTRDGKAYLYTLVSDWDVDDDVNPIPGTERITRILATVKDGIWSETTKLFAPDSPELVADKAYYGVDSGLILQRNEVSAPLPANDVPAMTKRLRQKALQTDLSAAQTLAYWNVMEEVSKRYRDDCSYIAVERGYVGYIDPFFEGFLSDVDGDGITELEIIGELFDDYGDTTQYWRELWDYDGTKAYLVQREEPYSYTPLIRDSDYTQFYLTRDQLNHHWVEPTQVSVSLNGTIITLSGCLCESNNYIRIRDIAMLLNGTEKQFDFGPWSLLLTSTPYTPTGVEYTPIQLQAGDMYPKTTFDYVPATPEYYKFLQDYPTDYDSMEHADSFVFGGNNFVKLRDIARVLDFYVGWDGATNTVVIDPARGYAD